MNQQFPTVQEIRVHKSSKADVVMSLENLIKTNIESIDKLAEEAKKHKEMLTSSFENDPTYREHEEKVKEATKLRNTTKEEITKQPSVAVVADKIKDIAAELKEKKAALSDYLLEYERLTEATQLELFDGSMVKIVKTATVKRAVKNR